MTALLTAGVLCLETPGANGSTWGATAKGG